MILRIFSCVVLLNCPSLKKTRMAVSKICCNKIKKSRVKVSNEFKIGVRANRLRLSPEGTKPYLDDVLYNFVDL